MLRVAAAACAGDRCELSGHGIESVVVVGFIARFEVPYACHKLVTKMFHRLPVQHINTYHGANSISVMTNSILVITISNNQLLDLRYTAPA